MPNYKRQKMIEEFMESGEMYQQIDWEVLGYCDHTVARVCLDRVIKACGYHVHMARSGQKLYIVWNGCDIPRESHRNIYTIISQQVWNFIRSGDKTGEIIGDFITRNNRVDMATKTIDVLHGLGYGKKISVVLNRTPGSTSIFLVKNGGKY